MVGLIPLLAVEVLEDDVVQGLKGFKKRLDWFLQHRPDLQECSSYYCPSEAREGHGRRLLAIPSRARLERVLKCVFDEEEFLSPVRDPLRFKNPWATPLCAAFEWPGTSGGL